MSRPSDTIESREPRYGDYYERSELKERIVEAFSGGHNWMDLEPDARNSLMMIADKLSRVLNGDADDPDSWHDIGGYAGLVEKRLNGDGGQHEPMRRALKRADATTTRCLYFTGTPPSWDDAPEWANYLTQDLDGEFFWGETTPFAGIVSWGSGRGRLLWCGSGLHNPNWKHAIEPRPETHK